MPLNSNLNSFGTLLPNFSHNAPADSPAAQPARVPAEPPANVSLGAHSPIYRQAGHGNHPGISTAYQDAGLSPPLPQTEMSRATKIHRSGRTDEDKQKSLKAYYSGLSAKDRVTVIVGGGTAALTYLATKSFDPLDSHILVLGTAGYWGDKVAHRLAQPHHIFALPHEKSAEFVDPSDQDKRNGILPHQEGSAYVHSKSYQTRLGRLEKMTLDSLRAQGKNIHVESGVITKNISKDGDRYRFKLNISDDDFFAHKMVVATGAAPGRKLPDELMPKD